MDKKNLWIIRILIGVVFVTFNIIIFLVGKNFNTNFWICYIFMALGFVGLIITSTIYILKFKRDLFIFSYPLVWISFMYLLASLITSLILLGIDKAAIAADKEILPKVILIPHIIITCIYIVVMGTCIILVNYMSNTSKTVREKVFSIKSLGEEVKTLTTKTNNNEIREALERLAKNITYSDPMSSYELANLENEIRNEVFSLRQSINDETIIVLKQITNINDLVSERNRKCKLLK